MNIEKYYIYAIKSINEDRIYVGISKNIKKRLFEHNSCYVFSTKGYVPWVLIYKESVKGRLKAREREKYFKSGYGKEILKNIVNADVAQLVPACRQAGSIKK